MEIAAILKSFIYIVSASLLYPVLFALSLLVLWLLAYCGGFFAEWLQRSKLGPLQIEAISAFLSKEKIKEAFPHSVAAYFNSLRGIVSKDSPNKDVELENLLEETTLNFRKSLDSVRMVVRIGPSLGLIGTLIPMGTGLAALGQGDITKLSSDMVVAFTTTVVGLAVGIAAYIFYTIKRRWVEKDIKEIHLITELLTKEAEKKP